MKDIIEALKRQRLKIATAESCTGGLLASSITDISGASEVFELGFVSYSNRIKEEILGVPAETIEKFGVYSLETAAEMAKCARQNSGADIGIGITGVAGSEPQEGIPAGKVFIALASETDLLFAETEPQSKNRKTIKEAATKAAIKLLKQYLNEKEN